MKHVRKFHLVPYDQPIPEGKKTEEHVEGINKEDSETSINPPKQTEVENEGQVANISEEPNIGQDTIIDF